MGSHRGALQPHLNVVDDTLVAKLAPRAVSRRWEGIRADVQQRAVAAICDVDRGDRNCAWLAVHSAALFMGLVHTSRLVAQVQGVVLAGFAVDGPHAKGQRQSSLGMEGRPGSSRRTGRSGQALEHALAPEREKGSREVRAGFVVIAEELINMGCRRVLGVGGERAMIRHAGSVEYCGYVYICG
jgi:hypothetical protein